MNIFLALFITKPIEPYHIWVFPDHSAKHAGETLAQFRAVRRKPHPLSPVLCNREDLQLKMLKG